MKIMKKHLIITILAGLSVCGCADYLNPLPNGSYNEENYDDYPSIIRGYVEYAYDIRPGGYITTDYIGCDGLSDNMTWKSHTNQLWKLATGSPAMGSYSFSSIWNRDYKGIYYCNLFLKDDIGRNTRYMVDPAANAKLQKALQGDAYALRAWYLYDLLKFFGGRSVDGDMLGVPIFTEPVDPSEADMSNVRRATYRECVEQILKDCDSAYVNLPLGNRDFLKEEEMVPVLGAVRYRRFDGASVLALKATVLLTWASPAFNPYNDISRWDEAAKAAKAAIDYKLDVEGPQGFDPTKAFLWKDPNTSEAYYVSDIATNSTTYETNFYPQGFGGSASYAPTQELVDAFPMANGYPIGHPESGYDPENPYVGRDPRFYSTIFHDGAQVIRNTNASDIMYTFDMTEGGKDAPGLVSTSPTGYYIKKHVYLGWNRTDNTVQKSNHCIFFYRWTHMLLCFAEAANQVAGPLDDATYGMSAKEAIAYIRNRPQEDGTRGLGADGDPYLDETAASGADAFDELVKNEWRLETAFEGHRFHNLRRWAKGEDLSGINTGIHRVKITNVDGRKTYAYEKIEERKWPSLWLPLPYTEVRKGPLMVQNEGWETWK